MAFFSGVDAKSLPALLHVGFCARISPSQSDDRYLAPSSASGGGATLVARDAAPLWHVVSRDLPPPGGDASFAPRAAVAVLGERLRFLSLRGEAVEVKEEPGAVRVLLPEGGGGELGFRQVLQEKMALSAKGREVGLKRGASGGAEKWRVEVAAGSIGRGVEVEEGGGFVSLAEATVLAVLELGVRFRLRSVHGRVLSISETAVGAKAGGDTPGAGARKKGKKKPVIVRQDGPKTRLDEAQETELIFEPARRAVENGDGELAYTFSRVGTPGVLSVREGNMESTRTMARQTAAVLLRLSAGEASSGKGVLVVAPAGRGWGGIHIGERRRAEGGGGDAMGERSVDWLMAGPRGRLETRRHHGAWEAFSVEFVEQSYNAGLRELPASNTFSEADASERANARAEIAAKVSAARKSETATEKGGKKQGTGGFNHAAALAALGGEDPPAAGSTRDKGKDAAGKKNENGKAPKGGGNASKAVAGASVAAAASSVPRNAASKKARKKAKKDKKKQNKKVAMKAAGEASASSSSSPARSAGKTSSAEGSSSDADATATSGESASKATSSTSQSQPGTGPPCSACGRACTGTYTKAMGKDFHPQCFGCRMCRRPLIPGTGQFREHGGVPYCNGCYAGSIASKCARCAKPIMGTVTTAMEKTWHKECLTCVICRLPLTETFWLYADKPNEPRCSRCVTGSEERLPGVTYGGGKRAVNLPGPLFKQGSTRGPTTSSMNPPAAASGGRARITTPVLNPARR